MVKTAERDQVIELRLAAVGPVLDVVPVAEARAITAREPTTAVARFQRPTDRERDAARLAADVEGLALLAFDNSDDAGIAQEPPRTSSAA